MLKKVLIISILLAMAIAMIGTASAGWTKDDTYVTGISSNNGYTDLALIYENRSDTEAVPKIVVGGWDTAADGYYWNGTGWQTSSDILNGLPTKVHGVESYMYDHQMYLAFHDMTNGDADFSSRSHSANEWLSQEMSCDTFVCGSGAYGFPSMSNDDMYEMVEFPDGTLVLYQIPYDDTMYSYKVIKQNGNWDQDSTYMNGLPDSNTGYDSYNFETFYDSSGTLKGVLSDQSTYYRGYYWDGTQWVRDDTIVEGKDSGSDGSINIHKMPDGNIVWFEGNSAGTFNSYVYNESSNIKRDYINKKARGESVKESSGTEILETADIGGSSSNFYMRKGQSRYGLVHLEYGGSSNSGYINLDGAPYTNDVNVHFSVRKTSPKTSDSIVYLSSGSGDTTNAIEIRFTQSGDFDTNQITVEGSRTIWYATGQWYDFDVVTDFTNNSARVYLNGHYLGTFTNSGFDDLESIVMDGAGGYDIDDLKITSIDTSDINNGFSANKQWVDISSEYNSVASGDSYHRQTVFNLSGQYHIINNDDGTITGWWWDGTDWVTNSSITDGLSSPSSWDATPEHFTYNGDHYLVYIIDAGDGQFQRMWKWSGTDWSYTKEYSNGYLLRALAEHSDAMRLEVFDLNPNDSYIDAISSSVNEDGAYFGFTYNGYYWARNSSVTRGITLGNYQVDSSHFNHVPDVYRDKDDNLVLVSQGNGDRAFYWDGDEWVRDDDIVPSFSLDEPDSYIHDGNLRLTSGGFDDYEAYEYQIPDYSISGYVTNENGTAIENVQVSDQSGIDSATTDASGYYQITGYQDGDYTIKFEHPDYDNLQKTASVSGSDITNFNATMKLYSISGYVEDQSGNPIDSATVQDNSGVASTTTNSSGYYKLDGYLNGTYTINVTHPDYISKEQDATVSDADVTGVNFSLEKATSFISGYITDAEYGIAVDNATVIVNGTVDKFTTTNATGYFKITGLEDGQYDFTANRSDYYNKTDTFNITGSDVTGYNKTLVPIDPLYTDIEFDPAKIKTGEQSVLYITTSDYEDKQPTDLKVQVHGTNYTMQDLQTPEDTWRLVYEDTDDPIDRKLTDIWGKYDGNWMYEAALIELEIEAAAGTGGDTTGGSSGDDDTDNEQDQDEDTDNDYPDTMTTLDKASSNTINLMSFDDVFVQKTITIGVTGVESCSVPDNSMNCEVAGTDLLISGRPQLTGGLVEQVNKDIIVTKLTGEKQRIPYTINVFNMMGYFTIPKTDLGVTNPLIFHSSNGELIDGVRYWWIGLLVGLFLLFGIIKR